MHDVPTHLEVTDKLVFGLTAGQTLFCAASVFMGYSFWKRLQLLGLPLLASVPLAALASLFLISLTLIRPEERSLYQWSFILLRYLFQPKVCLPRMKQLQRSTSRSFSLPVVKLSLEEKKGHMLYAQSTQTATKSAPVGGGSANLCLGSYDRER
jgi:hypothetical protein